MSCRVDAARLVLGVEPLLAGVEAGDAGLERGEVALRALHAGEGVLPGQRQPAQLVLGRGHAAALGVDLALQPGQPLAAVGRGPFQRGDPALLVGVRLLGRLPGVQRLSSTLAVALHLGVDLVLLARGPARPARAARRGRDPRGPRARRRRCGPAPRPARRCPCSRSRRPDSAEPGLLGAGQRREVLAEGGLQPDSAARACRDRRLDLGAPLEQQRLVGELLLQGRAHRDELVGQQPGAGVADVGLHDGGLARHLGLPAERLELAADLAEQVAEPGEVALGRVELAERLLLALAVLEDAGGLLDEAAALLRGRPAGSSRAAPGRR